VSLGRRNMCLMEKNGNVEGVEGIHGSDEGCKEE